MITNWEVSGAQWSEILIEEKKILSWVFVSRNVCLFDFVWSKNTILENFVAIVLFTYVYLHGIF